MIIYPFPVIRSTKLKPILVKPISKKELKKQINQLFKKYKINKHD